MKPRAWSHSVLAAYELCPKKYYAEKVGKTVSGNGAAGSSAMDYGKELHLHAENRLSKKKTPIPLGFAHIESTVANIEAAPGETYAEQKLALNKQFQPTGFFDNDVWVRCILDAAKVHGTHAVVIDYKTGKLKDDFDQMDIAVAVFLAHQPAVETVTGTYIWFKDKTATMKQYRRGGALRVWADILPRVTKFEDAFIKEEWPATPNFLCRRYCAVTACPHHGNGTF